MKYLKLTALAVLAACAFAGSAIADSVSRAGVPIGDSTTVVAWQIHTGGQIIYVTSDAMLKGRAPQTDNLVVIDNTVDLFDQGAAVAYVQANYGSNPYLFTHQTGGRLKAGADGVFGAGPGVDGVQGTADDLASDDYRSPTRDWF
jgi:hypothetical protein